ncbi:hypothetical protein GCM10009127_26490 [Alteraurantiacibacter aestuarii]
MLNFRRKRLAAAGLALAALGMAAPAQAMYVVTWFNSYGNGVQYVCDDNLTIFYQQGTISGTPMVTEWYPGQVC